MKDEKKMLAKMKMLKELKKAMKDDDASELMTPFKDKMEKVTVMAPDKDGLKKGLSMAEKIMEKYKSENSEEEEGDEMADGGIKGEVASDDDKGIYPKEMDMDKMDLEDYEMEAAKEDLKKKEKVILKD